MKTGFPALNIAALVPGTIASPARGMAPLLDADAYACSTPAGNTFFLGGSTRLHGLCFANGPSRIGNLMMPKRVVDTTDDNGEQNQADAAHIWEEMLSTMEDSAEDAAVVILRSIGDGVPTPSHLDCIVRFITDDAEIPPLWRETAAQLFSRCAQAGADVTAHLKALMETHDALHDADIRKPIIRRTFASAFFTLSGASTALQLLGPLITSHNVEERRSALFWIQGAPPATSMPVMTTLMNDVDIATRQEATNALLQHALSDRATAEAVIATVNHMLSSSDPAGRRQAAKLLEGLAARHAEILSLDILMKALEDPAINDFAASILTKIASDERIILNLITGIRNTLVRGKPIAHAKAAHVLGTLACNVKTQPAATQLIQSLAKSEDARTRIAVVDAIMKASSIAPLNSELKDILVALRGDSNLFVAMHAQEQSSKK
jgi:HEAT repeat protein